MKSAEILANISYSPDDVLVKDIYSQDVLSWTIPKDFHYIGFRPPALGEWFVSIYGGMIEASASLYIKGPRLIFSHSPPPSRHSFRVIHYVCDEAGDE